MAKEFDLEKACRLRRQNGLGWTAIATAMTPSGGTPLQGTMVKNKIKHLLTPDELDRNYAFMKTEENYREKLEQRKIKALESITDEKLEESGALDTAKVFDILNKTSRLEEGKSTENVAIKLADLLVEAYDPVK